MSNNDKCPLCGSREKWPLDIKVVGPVGEPFRLEVSDTTPPNGTIRVPVSRPELASIQSGPWAELTRWAAGRDGDGMCRCEREMCQAILELRTFVEALDV